MIELLFILSALLLAYLLFPSRQLSAAYAVDKNGSEESKQRCSPGRLYVPEDAVLRRHFISQVRCEIEAGLHPRPVDSILQLDYDALVDAKLEDRLTEIGSLQSC